VIDRADDVGDFLGDDHDLAVVEAHFGALPAPDKAKRKLARRLEKRRERLQKKALAEARKLYRKKTERVVASVAISPPS